MTSARTHRVHSATPTEMNIWLEIGASSNLLQVTPSVPSESCSLLEEAVGFQSFVFANRRKILLAWLAKIENHFAIYE